MDDEEVDWEVDEEQHIRRASMHNNANDDADDAVSLGPDDDEPEYYGIDAAKDALPESDPPASSTQSARAPTPSSFPAREDSSKNGTTASPQRPRGPGHGIPGLPPKPSAAVAFNSARPRPSHPSLIAATAMSRSSKPKSVSANSSADEPPLPPDWQARQAQSQQGAVYYYNVRTHVTQWERPTTRTTTYFKEEISISAPANDEDLSFDDRHYRPGSATEQPRGPKRGRLAGDSWPEDVPSRPRGRSPQSSPQRGRADARPSRSHRAGGGRQGPTNYDRRSLSPPPSRGWPDPPSHREHSPQTSHKAPRQQNFPEPMSIERDSRFSDGTSRGSRRDRDQPSQQNPSNPTSRYRSPSRELAMDTGSTSGTSQPPGGGRRRSRFGPPPVDQDVAMDARETPSPAVEFPNFPPASQQPPDTRPPPPSRKRAPLPPQGDRFRQASRGGEPSSDTAPVPVDTPNNDVPQPQIPLGPRLSRRANQVERQYGPSHDGPGPPAVGDDVPKGPRAMQESNINAPLPVFGRRSPPPRNGWDGPVHPMERGQGRAPRGRDHGSGSNNTPIPIGARKSFGAPVLPSATAPPALLPSSSTASGPANVDEEPLTRRAEEPMIRKEDVTVRKVPEANAPRFEERTVRNAEEPSHRITDPSARAIEELPSRRVEGSPPRRFVESPPLELPDKFIIPVTEAYLWKAEDLKGYREILTLDSPNVHPEERKALLREAGKRKGSMRIDPNRPQFYTYVRDTREREPPPHLGMRADVMEAEARIAAAQPYGPLRANDRIEAEPSRGSHWSPERESHGAMPRRNGNGSPSDDTRGRSSRFDSSYERQGRPRSLSPCFPPPRSPPREKNDRSMAIGLPGPSGLAASVEKKSLFEMGWHHGSGNEMWASAEETLARFPPKEVRNKGAAGRPKGGRPPKKRGEAPHPTSPAERRVPADLPPKPVGLPSNWVNDAPSINLDSGGAGRPDMTLLERLGTGGAKINGGSLAERVAGKRDREDDDGDRDGGEDGKRRRRGGGKMRRQGGGGGGSGRNGGGGRIPV